MTARTTLVRAWAFAATLALALHGHAFAQDPVPPNPPADAPSAPTSGDDAAATAPQDTTAAISPETPTVESATPAPATDSVPPVPPQSASSTPTPRASAEPPHAPPDERQCSLAGARFAAFGYVAATLAYGYGKSSTTSFDLGALGVAAGASLLTGACFPGARGGDWHGALIRPSVELSTGALFPSAAGRSVQGIGMLTAGLATGYQYLRFRPATSHDQKSYGASASYRVGYQYTVAGNVDASAAAAGGDIYQGVGLAFSRLRREQRTNRFGLFTVELSWQRLTTTNVNLCKLSLGRGF